jgi:multiple sugar transport system substrate-binding protein
MLKRSLMIGLALVLTLTLVLGPRSARAADPTATPAPLPTNTPIPTAVLGTGSMQISLQDGLTGSDGSTLDSMISNFVKENADISVTDEEIDWNLLYPKLTADFVAGQPPDVFIVHVAEIPYYLKQGMLQPVDDLFDDHGGTLPTKDFADPAYSNTIIDGPHYGVLLDNHGFGTWANVDLLKAAGIDPNTPPKDAKETLADLQKLTLDKNGKNAADPAFDPNNIVQWGTAMDWQHYTFQSFLFQFGGTVISADGKKATINEKAGVDALQAFVDLIYKYHVMPAPAGFSSWDSFIGGKVGFFGTGTWFRNRITTTKVNWVTWPMYQIGPNPGVMFGAHVFLIPTNTTGDKLVAVKKLLVWLSNHDDQWAASGQVPARISIRDGLDLKSYPSNVTIGKSFQAFGHMEVPSDKSLDIGTAEDPEIDAALAGARRIQLAGRSAGAASTRPVTVAW